LREAGLLGGYRYFDAQTDDARLVLRIIRESVHDGGVALNYARVISLLRDQHDHVCGIVLRDEEEPNLLEIEAPVVINATGAWADEIRIKVGGRRRLRHLRGSHLVFPADQFPLTRAISFLHPTDSRPVFAFPWEGVTVLGTTDVDHGTEIETDPAISPREAHYLLTAGRYAFPVLDLRFEQVLATFSGIRAVLDTGKADPSKESREHFLWEENGLVTVTGGKLTTFRIMAHDALESIRYRLPGHPSFDRAMRMLDEPASPLPSTTDLAPATRMRLAGRYGSDALALLKAARAGELANIGETPSLWAELRWAARSEGVVHLDDLLLRRVRVGIITAEGGLPLLKRVRSIVQPELGWNDERWAEEVEAYTRLWTHSYSPPHFDTSPADQRLAA
jgi:glycerol-3-phosphate dehydrogenase